ncbi:hypothetical protein E2C01_029330 [Portunus trituberculatus]|uniref:Uncharacterized protein n=1 Tax=Portunus trituberculatus TaxID=210409 RepID=A0A5B7ESM0_PORTR|nr:hypothetical protein [Portunus trituberculatus]
MLNSWYNPAMVTSTQCAGDQHWGGKPAYVSRFSCSVGICAAVGVSVLDCVDHCGLGQSDVWHIPLLRWESAQSLTLAISSVRAEMEM